MGDPVARCSGMQARLLSVFGDGAKSPTFSISVGLWETRQQRQRKAFSHLFLSYPVLYLLEAEPL